MKNIRFLSAILFLTACLASPTVWGKDRPELLTSGMCDGLPRVPVTTMAGFCVGLVAQGFDFPRGVLPLPSGDVLVVDMGGWGPKKGSLWRVTKKAGVYTKSRLLRGLDRPHGIVKSPAGLIYVASIDRVSMLEMGASTVRLVDVIGGDSNVAPLPTSGRHPLKQLVVDRAGNLFVNIGSASDNCEQSNEKKGRKRGVCQEATGPEQRGAIRKYTMRPDGRFDPAWEVYASGLRNSMGLTFEPVTQALWQVENARDAISKYDPTLDDARLPHDELNLVKDGRNYGWPYCYDVGVSSPEYPQHDCSPYEKPALLLPAHSAPLGMAFHAGRHLPPAMRAGLFVTLHGYRRTGHRIVYLPFNSDGQPTQKMLNVVSGWDKSNGLAKGAPVDIRVADDGALLISDDRNGNLLRLTYVDTP